MDSRMSQYPAHYREQGAEKSLIQMYDCKTLPHEFSQIVGLFSSSIIHADSTCLGKRAFLASTVGPAID